MKQDDLLNKWLNGSLSADEKRAFDERNDAEFNQYLMAYAKHFRASHFTKVDDFKRFKVQYKSRQSSASSIHWKRSLLKIASMVVLALGVYFTIFYQNETSFETQISEKTILELPDKTSVQLNALSTLSYNSKDWKTQRSVFLDGEAFFIVSKGSTFDVNTVQGKVTVVGTQFNVKQRTDYFEVTCFEGIVKVASDTINRTLLAGDTYRILNGEFSDGKTTELEPRWSKDMSYFEQVPFKEVLSELERQYHIEVTLKSGDKDRLFTGGFSHNHLEKALMAITQPMNLTYELTSSKLVIIHGNED